MKDFRRNENAQPAWLEKLASLRLKCWRNVGRRSSDAFPVAPSNASPIPDKREPIEKAHNTSIRSGQAKTETVPRKKKH